MGNHKRILYLDIIRCVACLMVICMHAPLPCEKSISYGIFLSSLSYFTAPCIGLFFMVSGALLLPLPTQENTFLFLKKRFTKVLGPTLFWTVFYLVLKSDFSLRTWFSIPFSAQGHGILWFMYTLIGLYLISPILSAWLRNTSEKELRFYLFLWAITLCYPILEYVVGINEGNTGILYYFTGYCGYFLLGYYMVHYGNKIKWKWAMAFLGIAIFVPVSVKLARIEVDFLRVFWYLSIFVASMCVFWWKLVVYVESKISIFQIFSKFIILFSNLSFGIYLSHIFVMRFILWNLDFIQIIPNYYIQTFAIISLTLIGSFIISYLISKLPFAQYFIGYRCKL